ncbi:peptide deformylase [Umezawaea tangerina]|uniref:Peptide deformylase n=1 Tax=Umezawaea tangerina TaxID=84725 RepID=A0A2T0T6M7_9PSEU|nr:peptide deformylase [Umezawaea tangerina]PRY41304.1 peptide deformylase [Umezawaea tangerina]
MKSVHREKTEHADTPLSEKMAQIGIVQADNPVLRQVARPFDLPEEAAEARQVVAKLHVAMTMATGIHRFAKGMGVAAPQRGIGRAAAVVRTVDGDVVELLNPRIVGQSAETDEQYEGCWSFFDVRGRVRRPLCIEVEYLTLDGATITTWFDHGTARLVAHEVDHLQGRLYTDWMDDSAPLLPVAEYRELGLAWKYSS